MKRYIKIIFSILPIFPLLLVMAPFFFYEKFNQETPIAKLEFKAKGHQQYEADLSSGEGFCTRETYAIEGDQAQIDASFMKWPGLMALIFEPIYRLDRLSGRYREIVDENSKDPPSYDLSPEFLLDPFSYLKLEGQPGELNERYYGSSVYFDINPKLTYTILTTEDGLTVKSESKTIYITQNGELTIPITSACAISPNWFITLTKDFNDWAVNFLK